MTAQPMSRLLLIACSMAPCLAYAVIAYQKDQGGLFVFCLFAALFVMAVIGTHTSRMIPAAVSCEPSCYLVTETFMTYYGGLIFLIMGSAGWLVAIGVVAIYFGIGTAAILSLVIGVGWWHSCRLFIRRKESWHQDRPSE